MEEEEGTSKDWLLQWGVDATQNSRADTWEHNPGSAHIGECSKAVAREEVLVLILRVLSL